MAIYITDPSIIRNNTALSATIAKTNPVWTDAQINNEITEAETYIEGRLIRMGYSRNQLVAAPATPCALMLLLVTLYVQYVVLRDIYADVSPKEGTGERYEKWKDKVDSMLTQIDGDPDKNGEITLQFIDSNGNLMTPDLGRLDLMPGSNTLDVDRAITMEHSEKWKVDETYSTTDVVGHKSNAGGNTGTLPATGN